MSKARLAAEAYFARPSADSEADLAGSTETSKEQAAADTVRARPNQASASPAAVGRTPKVFRIASPGLDENDSKDGSATNRPPGSVGRTNCVATERSRRARARRRPEQMSGHVTIVHAAPKATTTHPSAEAVALDDADLAGGSALKVSLAELRARLQALELEIEHTRARDVAAAIAWIRQAMVDHRITVADLRVSEPR